MSAANPRYTKLGLDPAGAFLLASRMATSNALADAVIREELTEEQAQFIIDEGDKNINRLVRDEDVEFAPGSTMALERGNRIAALAAAELTKLSNDLLDEVTKELNNGN